MSRVVRVWWPTAPPPGNFGDVLTPVLLRHFGYEPLWTSREDAEVLCVGSIIKFARPGMTVLGSGAMWADDRPSPAARYLAVRGPITRSVVWTVGGTCPEVYGDPVLLLPQVYARSVRKRYDVGIVPHYVDFDWAVEALSGYRIIRVLRADPLEVVREILECRSILSSSLHGVIAAHAYGIPAAWIRFSDKLNGDGTKFADYALSVGLTLQSHTSIEDAEPVLPSIDTWALEEAFRCL